MRACPPASNTSGGSQVHLLHALLCHTYALRCRVCQSTVYSLRPNQQLPRLSIKGRTCLLLLLLLHIAVQLALHVCKLLLQLLLLCVWRP